MKRLNYTGKNHYNPLTPLKRVNGQFVQLGGSCSGDNLTPGDSLSIVACQQLQDAMSPEATALSECIARHGLFDSIDILEQEGIPKDWGIMLLPLIQQQMGGEQ